MVINRRRADGFTLLEVLVVVFIMGLLMAVGVPGIKTLLNTQKMKSATFDLVTTAMLARSEAMKWGGGNPNLSPPAPPSISIVATSNDFRSGWCITFTNQTDCASPYDGVMQIIKPTPGVTYTVTKLPGNPANTAPVLSKTIVFGRTGRLAHDEVKFLVTDDDNSANSRCVTFDTNGNASVRVMSSGAPACS